MSARPAADLAHVVPARPADRQRVGEIAALTGAFNPEEVHTALELFDGYLRDAAGTGYNFLAYYAPDTGQMQGYVCWGLTSLSKGAADLFWLATDPAAQGRGIAAALFRAAEAAARAAGRWVLMLYTSSSAAYAAARRLYIREGYQLAMQIAGFYDRGDDLCVYVKYLDAQPAAPVALGPGEQ